MADKKAGSDNSVVILPSCLFHIGNTQREQDLLNLPPPSCSSNPGSVNLFQLRTKGSISGMLARSAAQPVPRDNKAVTAEAAP
ncbi:unnamed protein product [Cladocopium goreaui]|uniref:Uncharacterized protein n=1 Tax=Cladocopium goreaui TaxID=2562237 RepID=A0A9P1M4K6_9DINO|nr:unnamed protein product [Cladocopium goreaui]|mmetsp:Transcript_48248/g.105310  ORF Transcript_48248/g.105310 Transcript_48248/m.105310 type:complete len:83 (+) Transcript_48248:42-290(+)